MLRSFFIFCSGANYAFLRRCPSEINKYAGIGATIFFTGVFAAIAGGYALFTVFQSSIIAVVFGLLWGAMIFNLDRYIVMSLQKRSGFLNDFSMAIPRLFLAILIAIVIAKPLEMKMFQDEIMSELQLMEQERWKQQEDRLNDRFFPQIEKLDDQILALKNEVLTQQKNYDELSLLALREADGTGGSMKKNLGPIYKAKKEEADKAGKLYLSTKASNEVLISQKLDKIADLNAERETARAALSRTNLHGLASQLEALGRLSAKYSHIFLASLFILLLFIAIETAPIFVKLISHRSPYDFVLNKHEDAFRWNHRTITEQNRLHTIESIKYNTATVQHRTKLAIEAENALAETLIRNEVEEAKSKSLSWTDYIKGKGMFGFLSN